MTLTFRVPQESILGPIQFTLYTCTLGPICKKYHTIYHLYADDQQIYLAFKLAKTGDKDNCIKRLETCIAEIREWMIANMVTLNDDQTEFIIFGTKQQLANTGEISIAIGSIQVQLVDQVRNLGYYMDQLLKNGSHINRLVSNIHLLLKNIHRIHSKLDQELTKTIIQATILSSLDYCNSLLLRTSEYQLHKLQQIQNMACRIVWNLRKYDHITNNIKCLQWLKIWQGIHYKVTCLVFNCIIKKSTPRNLIELILPMQQK